MKRKISKYEITTVSVSISPLNTHTISEMSFPDPLPHLADFELAQLQEKLRETELVMENIVSNTHHSPDRWVNVQSDVTRLLPPLTGGCCEMDGFSLSVLSAFQGEGRDGRSGGEFAAAANGDHSGDAGAPPGGGGASSREEELGGYTHTHT